MMSHYRLPAAVIETTKEKTVIKVEGEFTHQ